MVTTDQSFSQSSPTNAYSQIRGREWLSWHAGCQKIGRCCARAESQGMCNRYMCLYQAQIRLPTLNLKLRRDVTRSPKQGYQLPYKRTYVLQNKILKKVFQASTTSFQICDAYCTQDALLLSGIICP